MAIETIKFSQMTDGGDINNNKKTPGLSGGANVLFNNPWTFLPPGTTAERPAPSADINYRLRFNTDDQLYEYYDAVAGAWTQLQENTFTQGAFVTYTDSPSLPDAQNLGLLTSGLLKQTVLAGVSTLATAINGTDYWAPGDALTRTQVPVIGDDVTNKTYVDGLVGNVVISAQGTASQVLVNGTAGTPTIGNLTLSLAANVSTNNYIAGYATTVTAAGNTVLTVASAYQQFFTGTNTQTVTMPVVSTLSLGFPFSIINNSSATVTVQSSGGNTIQAMAPGTALYLTCIAVSGTTDASWDAQYAFDGGTGAVSAGLINQLAWYAANGSTVSGLTTANNSVLVTNGSGVPSLSTTLPAFSAGGQINMGANTLRFNTGSGIVDQNNAVMLVTNTVASAVNGFVMTNSATGNAPALGVIGSDPNILFQLNGKGTSGLGIQGVTSGANAVTGNVGELISSIILVGSPVNLPNNTPINITNITLTPGDWDVWGSVSILGLGSNLTQAVGWINSVSATIPDFAFRSQFNATAFGIWFSPVPSQRFNVTTNTTIYLTGQASFAAGSSSSYGGIYARRRR